MFILKPSPAKTLRYHLQAVLLATFSSKQSFFSGAFWGKKRSKMVRSGPHGCGLRPTPGRGTLRWGTDHGFNPTQVENGIHRDPGREIRVALLRLSFSDSASTAEISKKSVSDPLGRADPALRRKSAPRSRAGRSHRRGGHILTGHDGAWSTGRQ
eukprot:s2262_g5.t1